jgi:hypothetical protein
MLSNKNNQRISKKFTKNKWSAQRFKTNQTNPTSKLLTKTFSVHDISKIYWIKNSIFSTASRDSR